MKNHIANEVTHYKGQCYCWDVVNEAFNDDGTYRADVFYNTVRFLILTFITPNSQSIDRFRIHPHRLRNRRPLRLDRKALLQRLQHRVLRGQSHRGTKPHQIPQSPWYQDRRRRTPGPFHRRRNPRSRSTSFQSRILHRTRCGSRIHRSRHPVHVPSPKHIRVPTTSDRLREHGSSLSRDNGLRGHHALGFHGLV